MRLERKCPKCGSDNIATERRPNGDSLDTKKVKITYAARLGVEQ